MRWGQGSHVDAVAIVLLSTRYDHMRIYAGVMFLLYPIGIPAFYFILLYRNRRKIFSGNQDKV